MNDGKLDRLLESVRREVPPSGDLWASIAAQLEPRAAAPKPRRMWLALAAGIAVIALTAVVAWQFAARPVLQVAAVPGVRGEAPAAVGPSREAAAPGPLVAAAFDAPQDARYRETRAALEQTFRASLDLLAPETRTRIEQNLAIIRRANDEIRAALAADPNSDLLQQLLESTQRQEIELYTTVSRNTEPALPRTVT